MKVLILIVLSVLLAVPAFAQYEGSQQQQGDTNIGTPLGAAPHCSGLFC